jgi:hypothetical protein
MSQQIKPANCTCSFPQIVLRNMNGHSETCPVYVEWSSRVATQTKQSTICFDQEETNFLAESKEISIKDFVECGYLNEVNIVLHKRGLSLGFHKIGDVFSNAVFILDARNG